MIDLSQKSPHSAVVPGDLDPKVAIETTLVDVKAGPVQEIPRLPEEKSNWSRSTTERDSS